MRLFLLFAYLLSIPALANLTPAGGGNATKLQGTPVSASSPTINQCLVFDGTNWAPASCSSSSGTVTTVNTDSTTTNIFTNTANVIGTTSVVLAFKVQNKNKVLAGPTTGSDAAPTYRLLVGADLPLPGASSLGGVFSKAAVSHQFLTAIVAADGSVTSAQPAFTDVSGSVAAGQMPALTGDVTSSAGAVATTVAKIQGTTVSGTTGSGNVAFSSGPTLTNPVVGTQGTTDNSTKAASTAYVTTAISNAVAGVNPAVAVKAATTQASDTSGLTYLSVGAGIGDTFTGSTNVAIVFDGVTLTAVGQRVLVKNDTQSPSGAFNGVYYVTQVQTGILPPVLTRALDYDQPSDINNTGAIPVVSGTVNASTSWLLTSAVAAVGTDPLTYAKFSINPTTLVTQTGSTPYQYGNCYVSPQESDLGNSGSSKAIDLSTATTFTLTLNAATPTLTFSNPVAGCAYAIVVSQDGTGSRVPTWAGTSVIWGNSGTKTLSTTASAIDKVTCVYNGNASKLMCDLGTAYQ